MTVKVRKRKLAAIEVAHSPAKSIATGAGTSPVASATENGSSHNQRHQSTPIPIPVDHAAADSYDTSVLSSSSYKNNNKSPPPPPPPLPPLPLLLFNGSNGSRTLNSDTINYLHRLYCRECNMHELEEQRNNTHTNKNMTTTTTTNTNNKQHPKSPVEEASIQQAMDKNKESLKRKLMLRRSVNELVDQGIYPPLKTPPAFAEQRTKLERAKTGDILRHKLQQRPDRQALVQHHILEDTSAKLDPSLQERQRQLKRARLQDSLNERLTNRPGPLELVQSNILPGDTELRQAISEGKLQFTKTTDLLAANATQFGEESDAESSASESAASPSQHVQHTESSGDGQMFGAVSSSSSSATAIGVCPTSIPSPPDITPLLAKFTNNNFGSSMAPSSSLFTFTSQSLPLITPGSFTGTGSVSSSSSGVPSNTVIVAPSGQSIPKNNSSGSLANGSSQQTFANKIAKKKNKPVLKSNTNKSKIIKFHEYKGPPSLLKGNAASSSNNSPSSVAAAQVALANTQAKEGANGEEGLVPGAAPYNMLLQQQQLLLQWQLDFHQKSVPFIFSQQQQQQGGSEGPVSVSSPSPTFITPCATPVPPASVTPVSSPPQPSVTPQPTTPQPLTSYTPVVTPQPSSITPVSMKTTPSPGSSKQMAMVNNGSFSNTFTPVSPQQTSLQMASPVRVPSGVALPTSIITMPTTATTTTLTPTSVASQHQQQQQHQPQQVLIKLNKPKYSKLEDMKVAELKAECKKRNLPVSGPKPNLLERLRPHTESILGFIPATVATSTTPVSSPSPQSSVVSSSSLASPFSLQSGFCSPPPSVPGSNSSVINIQPVTPVNDSDMPGSPMSPSTGLDLNASVASVMSQPLSPPEESMDITTGVAPLSLFSMNNKAAAAANNNTTGGSTNPAQPMMVDRSRPPSVAPMDIDLSGSQSNLAALCQMDQNQNPTTTTASSQAPTFIIQHQSPQSIQAQIQRIANELQQQRNLTKILSNNQQPLTIHIKPSPSPAPSQQQQQQHQQQQQQVVSQQQPQQQQPLHIHLQPVSTPLQQVQQQTSTTTTSTSSSSSTLQKTLQQKATDADDTVREQQREIEALTKQLEQSRSKLFQAQKQAEQHQLTLAKLATLTQQNALNNLIAQQAQTRAAAEQATMQALAAVASPPQQLQPVFSQQVQFSAAQPQFTQAQQFFSQPQPLAGQPMLLKVSPTTVTTTSSSKAPSSLLSTLQVVANPPNIKKEKSEGCNTATTFTSTATTSNGSTTTFNTLLANTALQQSLAALASAASSHPSSKPNGLLMSPASVSSLTSIKASHSVPSSPVGPPKLQRSTTNPLFTDLPPLPKDPPKYDEAIRNKQNLLLSQQPQHQQQHQHQQHQAGGGMLLGDMSKCQAMDDVLEILIRNGELPPSAAQEPPGTPRSITGSSSSSSACTTATNPPSLFSSPPAAAAPSSTYYPLNGTMYCLPPGSTELTLPSSALGISGSQTVTIPTALLAGGVTCTQSTPAQHNAAVTATASPQSLLLRSPPPQPPPPPPPLPSTMAAHTDSIPPLADFPFITMDWSDSDLTDTLLGEAAQGDPGGGGDPGQCSSYTNSPCSSSLTIDSFASSGHPQQQAPPAAGANGDMNMEMSDWLDAIMPSTGLAPLSAAVTADPVLTPKPQDVLDLFNMEEADLYTPTDFTLNFDRAIEAAAAATPPSHMAKF